MEKDHIKSYWDNQAKLHKDSHWASWGDNYMIDLEIQTIAKYLSQDDEVLDVGCANGYSTFNQCQIKKLKSITGVDFSETMIEEANKAKNTFKLSDKMRFETADIRKLPFSDNFYDKVYTTRVLINLPTWEQQVMGIEECLRVTKKGGRVIFSEGFWEPLVLLNAMRTLKQLPPLVEHDFNRYIKKQKLEEFLNTKEIAFEADDFSSIYYLGSRFLRELVTNVSDYPGFSNPINQIFFEIEKQYSGGGFGIQQVYILTKP